MSRFQSYNIYVALLIMAVTLPAACEKRPQITPDQIHSAGKSINEYEDNVIVQGRWKKIAGTRDFCQIPIINTVYIVCDKQTMTCYENIAELVTPHEEPLFKDLNRCVLQSIQFEYKIIDWSDGIIRAKQEALVGDFELRISIKDKTAERSWRETKARGSETSDPSIYENCVLE